MNLKSVYILFGTLLAVLVAFAMLQRWTEPGGTDGNWVMPALHEKGSEVKANEVDRIELTRYTVGSDRKEEIVFVRKDGTWIMTKPHELRVQSFQVEDIASQLIRAKPEPIREITHNLSELGLKPAHLEVTIAKGDRSWTLMTSKPSSDNKPGSTVYVATSANPTVPMAVKASDLNALFKKSIHEYRERNLIQASPFNSTAIGLTDGKGKELAFEKSTEGAWRFTKPAYGPAEYDGDTPPPPPGPFGAPPPPPPTAKGVGVKDLLDAATGLRVENDTDFVAEGVSDAELASKYGLGDKPETLRIVLKANRVDGDEKNKSAEEVLLIGKKATAKESERQTERKDGDKKEEKKDEKAEYYYARVESEKAVVRIPIAKLDKLFEILGSPDKLRDRSLVQADAQKTDKIDAVDIKNSNGLLKFRKGEGLGAWTLYREKLPGQATEMNAVKDIIDALVKKKQVVDFVEKEDGLEFDKPAAVVSLWFEGIKKEEKKDDKKEDKKDPLNLKDDKKDAEKKEDKKDEKKEATEPTLTSDKAAVILTFGKRDRDKKLVYVRREVGDDKTIVRVDEALLDRVTAGPLAFAERKVPSFSQGFEHAKDVTKVVLTRGSETWEIARDKVGEKNVWKFAAPEALKGRTANERTMGDIVRDLATLRAERLVAEKAPESEMETLYGLKTPVAKAVIMLTRDGKPEEWVTLFGKETDGKNLFVKQGQRDMIFTVAKASLEPILSGDLRDPTVMSFEIAKVKSVKLSGWKAVAGVVTLLELERKGDKKWEAKTPAGFAADGDVVEGFVLALSNLKADRFVTPKTGAKTELDVNEGGLKIEVTVDGEEKPLEVNLGAEDADNKAMIFARTGKTPDVFLLPKFSFEKAKERIAHFAKK